MTIKLITRTAAAIAATGIAALPLTIGATAHAINQAEHGGSGRSIVVTSSDNPHNVDPTQVAAGALAGATVTGAALIASTQIRRHRNSAPRPA